MLVFKLADGWKPLCEFLGKPIPDQPFPHKNKGASVTDEIVDNSYIFDPIKKEFIVFLTFLIILLGCLLYSIIYK